jgi:hypothetical protein
MKILAEAEKILALDVKSVYKPSKLDRSLDYQVRTIGIRISFEKAIEQLIEAYPVNVGGIKLGFLDARMYYFQLSAENEDRRRSLFKTGEYAPLEGPNEFS